MQIYILIHFYLAFFGLLQHRFFKPIIQYCIHIWSEQNSLRFLKSWVGLYLEIVRADFLKCDLKSIVLFYTLKRLKHNCIVLIEKHNNKYKRLSSFRCFSREYRAMPLGWNKKQCWKMPVGVRVSRKASFRSPQP